MYRHRYHQHFAAPSSPANAAIELWALRYFWLHVFTVVFMVAWLLLIVAKWLWRNGPGWTPSAEDPAPPPPGNPPAAKQPINWEEDLFLPTRATHAPAVPTTKPVCLVDLEIDPFAPVVYWFKGPIKRKRK
jgi:hypothetical protein